MTTAGPATPLLSVRDLTVTYGAVRAVRGISFDVYPGEIVTLIGANGAGKSSTLRAISGVAEHGGEVLFEGRSLRRVPADRIAAQGIAHVPEGRGIFGALTVRENLALATWTRRERNLEADYDRVFALFPRLKERLKQPAGTLSGGEQQMLALGRALMTRSRLMLLDEPSMGLAPLLVSAIFEVLASINREGMTLVLVEQNAHMALRLAARAYVLETGAVALAGPCKDLQGDPRIKAAYLGG